MTKDPREGLTPASHSLMQGERGEKIGGSAMVILLVVATVVIFWTFIIRLAYTSSKAGDPRCHVVALPEPQMNVDIPDTVPAEWVDAYHREVGDQGLS